MMILNWKVTFIVFTFPTFLFSQIKVKVIGIKDGDTVTALDENKKQIVLRLAEVDCPENGQPFGKNAKQFTSNEVFGKIVFFNVRFMELNESVNLKTKFSTIYRFI